MQSMNYNDFNNSSSASKILESVLEDMNNLMKENETNNHYNPISNYNHNITNGNNNCLDLTPDKKFEYMLEELQNCLKETADTRNVMQNLSSDKKEFVRSLVRTDYDTNNMAMNHKIDLMNENSKLKLDIAFLERDKQSFLNRIGDLTEHVSKLEEENDRLKQEILMMRATDTDYSIPPMDTGIETINENDEQEDGPKVNNTKFKTKSIPDVPPHGNGRQFNELNNNLHSVNIRQFVADEIMAEQNQTKASSWSELRVNKITNNPATNVDFLSMTPPTHRKTSMQSPDRSRSFGKGDGDSDLRQKMKQISEKRSSQPPLSSVTMQNNNTNTLPLSAGYFNNKNSNHNDDTNDNKVNNSGSTGNMIGGHAHFARNHPLRMTAAPRLNGSGHGNKKNHSAATSRDDFSSWSRDHVCAFLHQIGLGMYTNNCRRWLQEAAGQQLINAPRKEIEKELNINNKIHLKKLLIHVRKLTCMHVSAATYFSLARPGLSIPSNFSIRLWLDDLGLLQYMNLFNASGVDGYLLDQMTLEDVQQLKITSELHVLSLKRGIQMLRAINYDLSLLIRRPDEDTFNQMINEDDDEEDECEKENNPDNTGTVVRATPGQVARWSQHQVMEWLRRIELPEYASNLRGSGVHGALMVLEDRFTAATLASVLNISRTKSLLRRHLHAKFTELIGPEITNRKKSLLVSELNATNNSSGAVQYDVLLASTKMKFAKKFPRRKSFFLHFKRKGNASSNNQDVGEEMLVPYTMTVQQQNIDLMLSSESANISNEENDNNQSQNSIPLSTN